MAQVSSRGERESPWLGITVDRIDPGLARQYGVPPGKGVMVVQVEPRSPAEDKGLQEGDIILEVNGEEIGSVEQYRKSLARVKEEKKIVLFLVRKPGGAMRFVAIRPKGS